MSYRRTIIIAMVSGIILFGCNSYPDPFFEYQNATTPVMLGQGTLSRDSLQWNNAFVAATKELYYTKSHATGADIRKFVWEEGAFMDKGKVEFPEDAIHSDVYVDEKGEVMLFSSTMLESETDTIGDWNIWKSERVGGDWQKPELYFSQPMPENEFYPTLADSGNLYFTMKEIKGRTLKKVMRSVHEASDENTWKNAPDGWNLRRLISAFHSVCETMSYASHCIPHNQMS